MMEFDSFDDGEDEEAEVLAPICQIQAKDFLQEITEFHKVMCEQGAASDQCTKAKLGLDLLYKGLNGPMPEVMAAGEMYRAMFTEYLMRVRLESIYDQCSGAVSESAAHNAVRMYM